MTTLEANARVGALSSVPRGVRIAAVMFGMYAAFGMAWIGVVPLFPEIRAALDVGAAEGAWLVSVVSLAKSVVPILAGVVAARIGLTSTMRAAGALIVLGLVVPWLPSYWSWLAGRFLFGVGGAVWVTLLGAVTLQHFSVERRPLVNALNGVAVNVGVILALQLTLPVAERLGWQGALSCWSILSAIFFVLLLGLGSLGEAPKGAAASTGLRYRDVLKMPVTWVISMAFTGPLALYLVLNTFLPGHFEAAHGISRAESMTWMSWLNLWGVPASICTGFLVARMGRTKPFIALGALLLPLAAALSLLDAARPLLSLLLALTGVGLFVTVSPLITLLQGQKGMSPATLGMVLGTMMSVTYVLSSVAPGLVGFFLERGVALQPLLVACTALAFSPAVALLLPEPRR